MCCILCVALYKQFTYMLPLMLCRIWKDYTVVNNLLELDRHMSVTNMKENIPESVRLFDKFYFPSEHTKLFGYYVVK